SGIFVRGVPGTPEFGDTIPNSFRGVLAGLVSHHGSIGTCDSSWHAPPCHPAGKPQTADVLRCGRLPALPRAHRVILPRRAGRDPGILLDAQSCSPDRCPAVLREPTSRHRRYTRWINCREGWRGHLWQGRFASFVMDEDHLLTAARYVDLNPVRAGLVQAPSR